MNTDKRLGCPPGTGHAARFARHCERSEAIAGGCASQRQAGPDGTLCQPPKRLTEEAAHRRPSHRRANPRSRARSPGHDTRIVGFNCADLPPGMGHAADFARHRERSEAIAGGCASQRQAGPDGTPCRPPKRLTDRSDSPPPGSSPGQPPLVCPLARHDTRTVSFNCARNKIYLYLCSFVFICGCKNTCFNVSRSAERCGELCTNRGPTIPDRPVTPA
jgi:hypothetical protein